MKWLTEVFWAADGWRTRERVRVFPKKRHRCSRRQRARGMSKPTPEANGIYLSASGPRGPFRGPSLERKTSPNWYDFSPRHPILPFYAKSDSGMFLKGWGFCDLRNTGNQTSGLKRARALLAKGWRHHWVKTDQALFGVVFICVRENMAFSI